MAAERVVIMGIIKAGIGLILFVIFKEVSNPEQIKAGCQRCI
jgi:hypothetical protein